MKKIVFLATIFWLIGCSTAPKTETQPIPDYAEQVRSEFLRAWQAFKLAAWQQENPLEVSCQTARELEYLGVAVNAAVTMELMNLQQEARATQNLIKASLKFEIDEEFSHRDLVQNLIGGLVSLGRITDDDSFYQLATKLAERCRPVFMTRSGLPASYINLKTGQIGGVEASVYDICSCGLEYGFLTQVTGDESWWREMRKALLVVMQNRSETGLPGFLIDIETGDWTDSNCHMTNTTSQWLVELHQCAGQFNDSELTGIFVDLHPAVFKYLVGIRDRGLWLRTVDMHSGEILGNRWTTLSAFLVPLLIATDQVDIAERVQHQAFTAWADQLSLDESEEGASIGVNSLYFQHPEIMESAWLLYDLTGDQRYFDMNLRMFTKLQQIFATETSYRELFESEIDHHLDRLHRFFLSGTYRYLFLTFEGQV